MVKKVRYRTDCHILHAVLLVTMLLLIITIICYLHPKHGSKQKSIDAITIQSNECKKVCIKNRMCYYFDELIKL